MKKQNVNDGTARKHADAIAHADRDDTKKKRKRAPKLTVSLAEKLAFTVPEVIAVTTLGETTIYKAIGEKKLIVRKYGTRTVALRSDVEAFLNSLPAAD